MDEQKAGRNETDCALASRCLATRARAEVHHCNPSHDKLTGQFINGSRWHDVITACGYHICQTPSEKAVCYDRYWINSE